MRYPKINIEKEWETVFSEDIFLSITQLNNRVKRKRFAHEG